MLSIYHRNGWFIRLENSWYEISEKHFWDFHDFLQLNSEIYFFRFRTTAHEILTTHDAYIDFLCS